VPFDLPALVGLHLGMADALLAPVRPRIGAPETDQQLRHLHWQRFDAGNDDGRILVLEMRRRHRRPRAAEVDAPAIVVPCQPAATIDEHGAQPVVDQRPRHQPLDIAPLPHHWLCRCCHFPAAASFPLILFPLLRGLARVGL